MKIKILKFLAVLASIPVVTGFSNSYAVLKTLLSNMENNDSHRHFKAKRMPALYFRRNDEYFDEMQNASILVDIFIDRSVLSSSSSTSSIRPSERQPYLKVTPSRPSKLDLPRKNTDNSQTFASSLASVENNIGRIFMIGAILLVLKEVMTGRSTIEELQVLLQ